MKYRFDTFSIEEIPEIKPLLLIYGYDKVYNLPSGANSSSDIGNMLIALLDADMEALRAAYKEAIDNLIDENRKDPTLYDDETQVGVLKGIITSFDYFHYEIMTQCFLEYRKGEFTTLRRIGNTHNKSLSPDTFGQTFVDAAILNLEYVQRVLIAIMDELYACGQSDDFVSADPDQRLHMYNESILYTGISFDGMEITTRVQPIANATWRRIKSEYSLAQAHEVNSLLEWVKLELLQTIMSDNILKKCGLCGKYFFDSKYSNTIYCHREDEDGKSCRDVGSLKVYRMKVQENPIWVAYQKAYKQLYARANSLAGWMSMKEFTAWSKEARTKRDACLAGEMSDTEFCEWLNITTEGGVPDAGKE